MKMLRSLFLVSVFSLLANTAAWATPLDLVSSNAYEFGGGPINVTYDSATSNFQAVGVNFFYGYEDPGLLTNGDYGNFTLVATIDHAGVLKAGTLTIAGDLGNGMETLLAGDLVPGPSGIAFGFADPPITNIGGGNIFDFKFLITGGEPTILLDDYTGQLYGGIYLGANFEGQNNDTPFPGTWTKDFNNNGGSPNGAGLELTFLIPEPSSILLVLTGGVLFAAAGRRRLLRR
jgi:hypothetical protein